MFLLSILSFSVACNGDDGLTLRVFAASSLTEAFTSIAQEFEAENPGVGIDLDFGGSQRLRSQLEFGAQADVFASADNMQMDILLVEELLYGMPVDFGTNELVVITIANGPVNELGDLAKPGVKVVLAQPSVPVGAYSRQVLANLSAGGFGVQFKSQVLGNLVSEEANVRFVSQKVALGEVDAGIVYQTDVATTRKIGAINTIPIPKAFNIKARYPIAVLNTTRNTELTQSFVRFVLSETGQNLLADQGFSSP
jgi:molybdate transport system substrate-binding protein